MTALITDSHMFKENIIQKYTVILLIKYIYIYDLQIYTLIMLSKKMMLKFLSKE